MFPPLQWDKLHLKVWSLLRGEPLQGHVQFGEECDHVQFREECDHVQHKNKVGTKGIHSLNLLGENSLENVQKLSQKYHLLINAACVRTLT
jgi:hypothetical protein